MYNTTSNDLNNSKFVINNRLEQDRELNNSNKFSVDMNNRLMDRSGFFEMGDLSQKKGGIKREIEIDSCNPNNNINSSKKKFGEITGQEFDVADIEYGMPIRSAYSGKKLQMNIDRANKDKDNDKSINCRTDFDLYNDNPKQLNSNSNSNTNIDYHDPINSISTNYSLISGASAEKVIPELYGTDPGSFLSVHINKFSVNFFTFLKNQLDEKFCISPYGIFNIFSILYLASRGNTETDIYDFFSMISKDNVLEGLNYIKQYIPSQMKNIISINKELPINKPFVKHINGIVDVYPIAVNDAENTSQNINQYINKFSQGTVQQISVKIIEKAQILCINLALFKPIWKFPFIKIIDSKFMGWKQQKVRMLVDTDCQHEYYEDNLNQIVELKCANNVMSMGIILPKELVIPEINNEELNSLLKNLKQTHIEEVRIPAFTQQIKMKLTNVLYQSGLKSVFHKLQIPDLVKTQTHISDVVQNITVIIANNTEINKNPNNKRMRSGISNIRFIADHPFIYYFRLIPTNTIILIGYYV